MLGSVQQEVLEEAVVRGVVAAYEPFRGKEGRTRLVAAMRQLVDADVEDLESARKRARAEEAEVEAAIARLLDHLSEATRSVIEERIAALSTRRTAVRTRLLELDRLEISRTEADELVRVTHGIVETLDGALRCGSPEQRVVTIRRCVEKIVVDAGRKVAVLTLRTVPQAAVAERGTTSTLEVEVELATANTAAPDIEAGADERTS